MDVLIKKARKKDPDAFVKLMDLNMQSMYKVAKSYMKNDSDVADVIQDTILTCYEKIGTLKENKYFKTWMIRILINKCNDAIKSKKTFYLAEKVPEVAFCESNFDKLEWNELLNQLDEKYRTILLLYYMEGFNTREIAQILELNQKTVQTRLVRGRSLFSREYLFEVRRVNE